jgi:GH15 family glucan-1,4-alpha-glucosidase
VSRIEDYAMIGDLHTAALVSREGSIDWFCAPRFDSPACFAALLGDEENGFWRIRPPGTKDSSRRYRGDSMVLETTFGTDEGRVTLVDSMPVRHGGGSTTVNRLVRGESGYVRVAMDLAIRFDYGRTVPWVRRRDFGITALSGPNLLELRTDVPLENKDFRTRAEFTLGPGEEAAFALTYRDSLARPEPAKQVATATEETAEWWHEWSKQCRYDGQAWDLVVRSLITLKGLTHLPSGGVVAAPTTSLPESPGGERNWDYRFCWLRDATFTLYALLTSGLTDEAKRWRDWLLRVGAGKATQLQTIYGPTGERLLPEFEIDWLPGYEGSKPVRVGNEAHRQLQLDVYGEIMDVFHVSRRTGIADTDDSWGLQTELAEFLESGWDQPDNGIWEVRGDRRQFTHSKVMAWVALDRMVKAVEQSGRDGPVARWRALREEIHADVCAKGFDPELNSFVQYYGGKRLDSALLLIPLVGFLPPEDPRCAATVAAIEKHLMRDGFLLRYEPDREVEGLDGAEGAFVPCTFWLADNYAMRGDVDRATQIFERLQTVANDVGLLSEEYDPRSKRQLGNFPQAFSHVSLVNTAHNLTLRRPAEDRSRQGA